MTDDDTLTTLTVTIRERRMLEGALTMTLAMVDALGEDTKALMNLWERVSEGVVS